MCFNNSDSIIVEKKSWSEKWQTREHIKVKVQMWGDQVDHRAPILEIQLRNTKVGVNVLSRKDRVLTANAKDAAIHMENQGFIWEENQVVKRRCYKHLGQCVEVTRVAWHFFKNKGQTLPKESGQHLNHVYFKWQARFVMNNQGTTNPMLQKSSMYRTLRWMYARILVPTSAQM